MKLRNKIESLIELQSVIADSQASIGGATSEKENSAGKEEEGRMMGSMLKCVG
jgi:hypothetical protein